MGAGWNAWGCGTRRRIQARSVSDCVGTKVGVSDDAALCVASDPPAYAEGFYGSGVERAGVAAPQDAYKPGA
jgi:hypothetical protein